MRTATLLLAFLTFATACAYSQAAAGYGGATATSATTAAGAAGGLGRAEGSALSKIGSAAANAPVGSASPKTIQVSPTSASVMRVRKISAELTGNLNSKDAKVGDEVTARTTSAVMLADGMRLPAGARLIGKVTEAKVQSGEQHGGRLAFAFHRIVLSDGHEIPIHATLDSISAPPLRSSTDPGRAAARAYAVPPGIASAPIRVTGAEGSTVYGADGAVAHGTAGNSAALSNLPGITAGSSEISSTILDAKDSEIVLSRGTQLMLTVVTH